MRTMLSPSDEITTFNIKHKPVTTRGIRHHSNGEIWVEIYRPTINSPLLEGNGAIWTFSAFAKKATAANRCGAAFPASQRMELAWPKVRIRPGNKEEKGC